MAQPKIIDFDFDLDLDTSPVPTKKFRLFGQEWTMLCDLNSFALSDLTSGEPAAIVRFIDSLIVEDERTAFRTKIASVPNLTPDKLGEILTKLVEAAGERPTTPPSGSSPGGQARMSPRKSAGSSSRTRAGG